MYDQTLSRPREYSLARLGIDWVFKPLQSFCQPSSLEEQSTSTSDAKLVDVYSSLILPYNVTIAKYKQPPLSDDSSSSSSTSSSSSSLSFNRLPDPDFSKKKLVECCLQIELRMQISSMSQPIIDPIPKYFRKDLVFFADTVSLLWEALNSSTRAQGAGFSSYLELLLATYADTLPRTMRGLYRHFEFDFPARLQRESDKKNLSLIDTATSLSSLSSAPILPKPAQVGPSPLNLQDDDVHEQDPDDSSTCSLSSATSTPARESPPTPQFIETDRLLAEIIPPKKLGHFVQAINSPQHLCKLKVVQVKPRERIRVKRRKQ